jgi:RNA polymerase sigma factor (sigma-70 family)
VGEQQAVGEGPERGGLAGLAPLVRRVVAARVRDRHVVDDLVQETLVRVLGARSRLDDAALAPYAVTTARNLVLALHESENRHRRNVHRLVEPGRPDHPEDEVLAREESRAVVTALARLSRRERETLVAHELGGAATGSLAQARGSTPGAVAAQLSRTRAKLRVEYLLARDGVEPPTEQCRPVLVAMSAGDRRRQRDLDAAGHLLRCSCCERLAAGLRPRRQASSVDSEARIPIRHDADVVAARQGVRELARRAGFSSTDLTLIATAVSEIARNIVRFAERGELTVRLVEEGGRRGVTVVARDAGPGIADVEEAARDGYSTYGGMGLGLPGSRRLMDEFAIESRLGEGTTVTMTKWVPGKIALDPGRRQT